LFRELIVVWRNGMVVTKAATAALTLCLAMLGIPAIVAAQDAPPFHWWTLGAGGGWAPAVAGQDHSSLNNGWNFQAGGGFALRAGSDAGGQPRRRLLYLNANFMFGQLAIKPSALQLAQSLNPTDVGLLEATSGRAKFYATTLDPTFRFRINDGGSVSGYFFGGFGWFRRSLEFTGVSGEGSLLQPSSPVVFGSGGNSGAYDAGGGIDFTLRRGLTPYVEVRLIHGVAINSASTLLPISAGIRW
jgi:hypothetical protein